MSADIAMLAIAIDSTQVAKAHGELDKLAAAGGRAEAANSSLQRSVEAMLGPLKNVYATIGLVASATAGWKMTQVAQEAAQLAARIETMDRVLIAVGNSSGYTEAQMRTAVEAIRHMGVTMTEARDSATKMAQSQLDLTKASQLARVAQDAAVIGNVNSSEALGRMINGIRSAEVETLRTIGINVSWEQSYARMAASVGKSVDSLNEGERAIARQNAVLEAGKNMAGAYAGAMDTAGKMLSSTARFIEDSTANIGQAFLPAYTDGVRTYYTALKTANDALQRMANDGTLDAVGKGIQGVASYADEAAAALVAFGAGRYLAPMVAQATAAAASFLQLKAAVASGNATYLEGSQAAALKAAAEREAAVATLANAQAHRASAAAMVASIEAEIALANAQLGAQITTKGRVLMVNELATKSLELAAAKRALAVAEETATVAQARATATTTAETAAVQALTIRTQVAAVAMKAWQSVLAFFGGPIGLGITAVGAAIYVLATQQSAAEKAAKDHADALRRIKGESDNAAPAIDKVTEALVRQQRSRVQQKVDTAAENMTGVQREMSFGAEDRSLVDLFRYGRDAALQIRDLRQALSEGSVSVEDFGDAIDRMAAKDPQLKSFAATIRDQVDAWKAARDAHGEASTTLGNLTGNNDAATAALERGRIASRGFEDALTNLVKASGLAVKDGSLMSQGMAELAGQEASLAQVNDALAGTFKGNGEAVTFTAEQMDRLREMAPQLAEAFRQLKERQDPVTQSVKAMADQMRLLEMPAGVMRDRVKAVQDTEREAKRSLTPGERSSVEGQVDSAAVAVLRDHNRELEQRARLERMVAAAAGGSAAAQAQAARTVELYNQALRTYGTDVAAAVLSGKPLPADLQETAKALRDVDLAKFGGEAARTAVGLTMQAEAQQGVASAALVSADAMKVAEIHARAVEMAYSTGAGSVEAWEKALLRVHEAEKATAKNEYLRQIQAQIAANDNLSAAYRDGSVEAIRHAEREAEIRDQMERLGIAYSDAAETVDRFRRSRDGLDNSKHLREIKDEIDAMERLGKARRGGEEAYRRQQAIEEADRHIRSSGVTDPEAKDAIRKEYGDRSAMASAYEAEARVLGDLHGRRERAIQDQEAINRLYKEGAIDAGQYRRLWRDAEIARLEDSQNANDGMTRGLLKYVRDAEDAASQVESLTANAFRGMEDVFVDFAKTGKLSFSKLADSIIEDITRMTAKALLLAPLAQFLASVFGTGGGAGGNVNLGSLGSMAMMGGGGGSGLNIGSFGGLAAGAAGMMGAGGGMSNLWSYLTTPDYLWSGGSPFDFFSAAPDMSGAVDLFANVPMEGAGELMDLGMMAFRNGGVFANDNVSSFAHGSVFGGRTMFSFANGGLPSLGELAEAGRSEGIIPLVRGPNGDLGVQNFGGGAGGANVQVTVEVYDQRRSGTDDIEVETFMTKLGPVVRIIAKDEADKRVGEFRNREMPALMRGDYSMSRQPVAR